MREPPYPTSKQEARCFNLCQNLTVLYCPIYLVRLDERAGDGCILAGEEIEIIITRDGEWSFENEV